MCNKIPDFDVKLNERLNGLRDMDQLIKDVANTVLSPITYSFGWNHPFPQNQSPDFAEMKRAMAGSLFELAGRHTCFVRLAGVSGAAAVGLGAYGAHAIREKEDVPRELKLAFDAGNRYHLLHSVALLGVPLCHYPNLTGSLLTLGILMFSGSCYYHALTGRTDIRKITPVGGLLLIAAWISMML